MKRNWLFLALLILSLNAIAQPAMEGILLSAETNRPVGGATIRLKQGSESFTTSTDGKFRLLRIGAEDTLVITHGIYSTLLFPAPPSVTFYRIVLDPTFTSLNEVVVNTGFQTLPKERATGAFESISEKKFNEQVSTNVLSRLESITNGLYFDKKTNQSGSTIYIRGISSIQGPRSPLIILDNFPYEGDLSNINPNDVENITILKDAAAASIWGTRAGNGVIVITTKKGRYNQKMTVQANSNISITQKPDLFYPKKISSSDFIDVEQFLFGKGFYTSTLTSPSRPLVSPVVEILAQQDAGQITAEEATTRIDSYRKNDTRNDFNRYMYDKGINWQHALNLNGGTPNLAWNFSAGFDDNRSNLGAEFNRITLKSDQSYKITSKLQLSTGLTFTHNNSISGRTGYGAVSNSAGDIPPYTMLADGAGNPLAVERTYRQAYLDTAGAGKLLDWNYYPLTDYQHMQTKSNIQEILVNIGLQYRFSKMLQAQISYQYQQQAANGNTHQDVNSYAARDLINSFSSINYNTGIVSYAVPKGGVLQKNNSVLQGHNLRSQLNFARAWGWHNIAALAGADIRDISNTSNSFTAHGYNAETLNTLPVDLTRFYPHFITGSATQIPGGVGLSATTNRFVSFFSNGAYTFKSRYTVSASARRDASNLFGVRTNNKWSPLWSAGLAWHLHKEAFFSSTKISQLKLRATYGLSGNADPSRSALTTLFYSSTNPYTFRPYARIDQFKNPDLRWERTAMLNLGLDYSMFNNRLHGSIEYYHKNGHDLIGTAEVDYTAVAAFTLRKNTASMKGSGWDFAINSTNIKYKNFSWQTEFFLSAISDKVTDYYIASQAGSAFVGAGTSISAAKGRPVYAVYSYRWAGLDPLTGDPMGYASDTITKDYTVLTGALTTYNNLVYHGRAQPSVFGSVGNTFSYKNWNLSARITYKLGHYFRRPGLRYGDLFNSARGEAEFVRRWQKPGDESVTNVPSLTYPSDSRRDNFYYNSEILVEKADHIRLQYISLAYNWTPSVRLKNFVKAAQCYANINNIGILWRANEYGIDPDYENNTILPGINTAIGIRLNF